ncbi:MAG TPA: phosphatase PAP2 family protein [Planctomycetaceae bacterium]|jgi:undecaprenyl-diphosphatase|nr:phosphatase PAP2 family protein [Planctomycetaceae bacterium]
MNEVLAGIVKSLRKIDDEGLLFVIRLLIVVLGTAAFIQLGREVTAGATQHFDETIVRSMRQPDDPAVPRGPVWLQDVARDITALGGYAILILLVGIIAGFLQLDGKKGAVRFLAGAVLSGYLVGMGLKSLFTRPRPSIVPHLSPVFTTSFPSGHSMMSAIVYLTLGALLSRLEVNHPRLRLYFIVVPLLLTGLVGVSRVYLGVHYPTDVLAGWTAGLVWATLCSLVAQRLQRRGALETEL